MSPSVRSLSHLSLHLCHFSTPLFRFCHLPPLPNPSLFLVATFGSFPHPISSFMPHFNTPIPPNLFVFAPFQSLLHPISSSLPHFSPTLSLRFCHISIPLSPNLFVFTPFQSPLHPISSFLPPFNPHSTLPLRFCHILIPLSPNLFRFYHLSILPIVRLGCLVSRRVLELSMSFTETAEAIVYSVFSFLQFYSLFPFYFSRLDSVSRSVWTAECLGNVLDWSIQFQPFIVSGYDIFTVLSFTVNSVTQALRLLLWSRLWFYCRFEWSQSEEKDATEATWNFFLVSDHGLDIKRSEGGGRGRLYTYRYTVTTRIIPALRWAAMRAILMFH